MSLKTWDAIASSDEEDAKPKVVRKQAIEVSLTDELRAAAEEARISALEGDRLEQQLAELEKKMCLQDAKGDEEAPEEDSNTNPQFAPSRRRRLDHTWETEAERKFEATKVAQASQVVPQVAGEVDSQLTMSSAASMEALPVTIASPSPCPSTSVPSAVSGVDLCEQVGSSSSSTSPSAPSSLRRLKQLDAAMARSIEQECGVTLQSSDTFRLTMDNSISDLKRQTRVLIVMAGSTFLCEKPISEEIAAEFENAVDAQMGDSSLDTSTTMVAHSGDTEIQTSGVEAHERLVAETQDEAEAEAEYEDDFEDFDVEDEDADCVVAELCFFRAKPSRGRLARKLGAVPVLHMTLSTSDGLKENLEFVGVHQRRYCIEEPGTDAIAKNITTSLLKVALEFVFHPSRTRYTKDHLILRERSSCAEALESREEMLLSMAEQVRRANSKIIKVSTEFLPARLSGSSALKGRSFLILDEDVLKVAPAKDSITVSRPVKSAFKGFSQGFLNSSHARKHGLSAPEASQASSSSSSQPGKPQATRSSCSNATNTMPVGTTATTSESSQTLENVSQDTCDSAVYTDHTEKRQLLLGAAEVEMRVSSDVREFAKCVIPGCGDLSASTAPGEEDETPEETMPSSISDLANQLFGSGEGVLDETEPSGDESLAGQTGSTHTPSPKGTSIGGGAPSERSETATEDSHDVDAAHAPAAGIRLLQQRRRERGNGQQGATASAGADSRDESEDLVNLWMKQRW